MPEYIAQNLVEVTLASGGINSSQTTIPLATGEGARVASTSGTTYYFPGVVYDSRYGNPQDARKEGKAEIVLVTSHDGSSDTISAVTRAQEGTSAIAHNESGVTYKLVFGFSKAMFDEFVAKSQSPVETGTAFDSVKLYLPSTAAFDYTSIGSFSQTLNRYYATFWEAPRDGVIGECLIQKATSGTSSANQRIGWFNPTSTTSLAIAGLIEQSGSIASSSDGAGSSRWTWSPSSLRVKRGRGYWIAVVCDATVSVYGATQGTSGSWQRLVGWKVQAFNNVSAVTGSQNAFTYAAFGDPFNGTFAPDSGARPVVWINYSS